MTDVAKHVENCGKDSNVSTLSNEPCPLYFDDQIECLRSEQMSKKKVVLDKFLADSVVIGGI